MLAAAFTVLMLAQAAPTEVTPPSVPAVADDTRPGGAPPTVDPRLDAPYAMDTRSEASDTAALIGQFVKTLVALGLVIAIIYILAKVGIARFIPGGIAARTGKSVRIVERVAVDQKNSLVLVEVGKSKLLLGSGERGLKLITRLEGEGASFQAVLDQGRVGTEPPNAT
jgi:flagellar protein FliO/FliZ